MLSKIKRLFYLSSIYSIESIFEKSLYFFLIPVYTTFLSTEDFGIIGLMSITIGLITKAVTPPINSGLIRFYYSTEYSDKQKKFIFNSFLFLTAQCIIFSLILYSLKNTIAGSVLNDEKLVHIVEVYCAILLFQPVSSFFTTLLRMAEKAKYLLFVSCVRLFVSMLFILYALIYMKLGVLALIYGNLLGLIIVCILAFPFFLKSAEFKIAPSILGPPLKYGYPLIIQGFALMLIHSGDQYILKFFTSVTVVGIYSFNYKFADIMNFLLVLPFKKALQPAVLQQENDPESLKSFVSKNCTYFYVIGMLLCLILSVFSKEIVQLMARREEFWSGWIIIPVIAYANLLHGLGQFFNNGLILMKKSYHISANILIAVTVNIGLNIALIPVWGIMGAAIATLISYIIWNVLRLYFSGKLYGLYFEIKRLGHITVVGAGLFFLSFYFAETKSIVLNVIIKMFFILNYPAVLLITGFFTTKEKDYLTNIVINAVTACFPGQKRRIR